MNRTKLSCIVLLVFFFSFLCTYTKEAQMAVVDAGLQPGAQPAVCVNPAPGMVSWWSGDGNANDVLGTNHGTPQNGATFAPGKIDQAFSFDGVDDYIRVADSPNLRVGVGEFTLDAWIMAPPENRFRAIASKFELTYPYAGYGLRIANDNRLDFVAVDCGTGDCGFGTTEFALRGTSNVADNQFHHVAGVRRADGTLEVYVDGVMEATRQDPLRNTDSSDPFTIGEIDAGPLPEVPFSGLIDDVRLYNRALTASEIQGIFNAGSAGMCRNQPPSAMCHDVTVLAGLNTTVNASIDDGSFDPDSGDTISITQSPPGPYPIGQTSVTLTVEDNHGASSSCQATVTVLYTFSGFFSPVENPPMFNLVNAGSAIPAKFSLNSNKGLNIFAAGYPVSQQIACSDGAPISVIEETVTAGSSSLSYDATPDQYKYVWKTDKAWKGTCRKLILKLNDSSIHVANFQFR